jgi:hypothetical protein
MGVASLGNINFRIDPLEISWPYEIQTAVTSTIGGKVVQVLGASLGDLTVTGTFGTGGWQEEVQFLSQITAIAENQTNATSGVPVRFYYPPRGFDFQVYVKAITPIRHTAAEFNPSWELTLFIVQDNFGITKTLAKDAMDAFIHRISTGIGWKQSIYNGPASAAQAEAILAKAGATTVQQYVYGNFRAGLGYSRTPDGGSGTSPSTSGAAASGTASGTPGAVAPTTDIQKYAQELLNQYGWGDQWTSFNNIVMAESSWNVTATNQSSGAYGIPQALPGSKMASAGADWQSNGETQLKWMMGYIQQVYGSPDKAWAFHVTHGWY